MTTWIESRLLPLVMAFAIGCFTGINATERHIRELTPVFVAAIDCDDGSVQPKPSAPPRQTATLHARSQQ